LGGHTNIAGGPDPAPRAACWTMLQQQSCSGRTCAVHTAAWQQRGSSWRRIYKLQ